MQHILADKISGRIWHELFCCRTSSNTHHQQHQLYITIIYQVRQSLILTIFTNIHLFDGFYFDNLTMNFIFSFVFSFDEMENHNDANDIVLVNIDAKSRLWMFWTSLVMKHFHRLRPKYFSVIVDFVYFRKVAASPIQPITGLVTIQNNPCLL